MTTGPTNQCKSIMETWHKDATDEASPAGPFVTPEEAKQLEEALIESGVPELCFPEVGEPDEQVFYPSDGSKEPVHVYHGMIAENAIQEARKKSPVLQLADGELDGMALTAFPHQGPKDAPVVFIYDLANERIKIKAVHVPVDDCDLKKGVKFEAHEKVDGQYLYRRIDDSLMRELVKRFRQHRIQEDPSLRIIPDGIKLLNWCDQLPDDYVKAWQQIARRWKDPKAPPPGFTTKEEYTAERYKYWVKRCAERPCHEFTRLVARDWGLSAGLTEDQIEKDLVASGVRVFVKKALKWFKGL